MSEERTSTQSEDVGSDRLKIVSLYLLLIITTVSFICPSLYLTILIYSTEVFNSDAPEYFQYVAVVLSAVKKNDSLSLVFSLWNAFPALLSAVLFKKNSSKNFVFKVILFVFFITTIVASIYPMTIMNGATATEFVQWKENTINGDVLLPVLLDFTEQNYQLSISYLALLAGLHFFDRSSDEK